MKRLLYVVFLLVLAGLLVMAFGFSRHKVNSIATVSLDSPAPSAADQETGVTTDEYVVPHDVRVTTDGRWVLYLTANGDLMLYDTEKRQRSVLKTDKFIEGYDISSDGRYVAYDAREWIQNPVANIWLLDTVTGNETRLEPGASSVSESGPVFFPDRSTLAYVRRTYDEDTASLSDGEIWTLEINKPDSRRHLVGDDAHPYIELSELQWYMESDGRWRGKFLCISNDEIAGPKKGISAVSPDGKHLAYWTAEWGGECSGLQHQMHFADVDGTDFFSPAYRRKYGSSSIDFSGKPGKFEWDILSVSWLPGGIFFVQSQLESLAGGNRAALYDNNQKELFVFYDTVSQTAEKSTGLHFFDTKPGVDGSILILYGLSYPSDVFLQRLDPDQPTIPDAMSGTVVFRSDQVTAENIYEYRIINVDTVGYWRNIDGHTHFFVFDVTIGKSEDMGALN